MPLRTVVRAWVVILSFPFFAKSQSNAHFFKVEFRNSSDSSLLSTVEVKSLSLSGDTISIGFSNKAGVFVSPYSDNVQSLIAISFGFFPLDVQIQKGVVGDTVDLGVYYLQRDIKQLEGVTVSGKKQPIKLTLEGFNYEVSADPDVQTKSVSEALAKAPLITVSASGDILMKGSRDFKFFLNGQPSASLGRNAKDILKSLPANSIERIEIISRPSSRYDAEGINGVINIITKRKGDNGIRGSAKIGYTFPYGYSSNLNLNGRINKLGLSLNAGRSQEKKPNLQRSSIRTSIPPGLDTTIETGKSKADGYVGYVIAELSFAIDSVNLLTSSFEYSRITTRREDELNNNRSLHFPEKVEAYVRSENSTIKFQSKDFNVNYQRLFKRIKNATLTSSYKYSLFDNEENKRVYITNKVNYFLPSYQLQNLEKTREQTGQIDLVYPFKSWTLETGVKGIFRNNESEFVSNSLTSDPLPDPQADDHFKYYQNVASFYNSFQFNLSKFRLKLGTRFENTFVGADFVGQGDKFHKTYSNLLPSVIINRPLSQKQSLSFSFNQRIQRPSIYQLNPFIDRSNPRFQFTGNPDLRPAVANNLELGFNRFAKGSFVSSFFYNWSGSTVQSVTRLIDSFSITRPENIGDQQKIGVDLYYGGAIGKLDFSLSGQLMHVYFAGNIDAVSWENRGWQGNVNSYAGYQLHKNTRVSLNMGYTSRALSLQGYFGGYFMMGISASQTILKQRGKIAVVFNNPFQRYLTFKTYIEGADFRQFYRNDSYHRTGEITFNFSFGKVKRGLDRSNKTIRNDDVRNKK